MWSRTCEFLLLKTNQINQINLLTNFTTTLNPEDAHSVFCTYQKTLYLSIFGYSYIIFKKLWDLIKHEVKIEII